MWTRSSRALRSSSNRRGFEARSAYALLLVVGAQGTAAQAPNPCAGRPTCTEVAAFVATVTELQRSVAGTSSVVTVTIRFTNKTPRALVVGYVDASGSATDDQGNRFSVGSGAVRGIGVISTSSFDPRFVLQPGGSADGRIEFARGSSAGNDVAGTAWDLQLTFREIDQVAAKQYKLGKEHVLQFRGLRAAGVSPN